MRLCVLFGVVWFAAVTPRASSAMDIDLRPLLNPNQKAAYQSTAEELLIFGGAGAGKCLSPDTPVIMSSGRVQTVDTVVVGDTLMGIDSQPRRVISVHRGTDEMYRVTQNKGMDYVVNSQHILSLRKSTNCHRPFGMQANGNYRWPRGRYANHPDIINIGLPEYLAKSARWKRNFLGWKVGVDFAERPVSVDAYLLGLWLGDGSRNRPGITTQDAEVRDFIYAYASEHRFTITINENTHKTAPTYFITHGNAVGSGRHKNELTNSLRTYGILNNKHIPDDYLYNSRRVRLELLAGIVDTDGYLAHGYYSVTQKSERLARQICFLANSLGMRSWVKKIRKSISSIGFVGDYWDVAMCGDVDDIPCRIARKRIRDKHTKSRLTGISVQPIGRGEYVGIELDGDGLFLLGDCTVVHNSFTISDKLLLRIINERVPLKFVVARRTLPSVKATAMTILEQRAKLFGLSWLLNKQDSVAQCANGTFLFRSANNKEDIEKLKSLTDVDGFWLNELPELRQEDYDECLRRMRGGQGKYAQMIADFNPIGKTSWVYERFFVRDVGHATKLRYTVMDNHPAYLATEKAQRYIARLRMLAQHNPNAYKIYFLGEWGELEGVVFDWDVCPLPEGVAFDSIFYGGDFGYSVDPAAVVKVYRKGDEYWVQEIIYETELTNQQLGRKCLRLGVKPTDLTYWDCAEPKSIAELSALNLAAIPCLKGPDSIRSGIDCLKQLKIHIVDGSENLVREVRSYVWKQDKDGHSLPEPVDFNDHAISAVRYSIVTNRAQSGMPMYTSAMLAESQSRERELLDKVDARLLGHQTVGCTEDEWRGFVRAHIQALIDKWRKNGHAAHADYATAEMARMDRVLEFVA